MMVWTEPEPPAEPVSLDKAADSEVSLYVPGFKGQPLDSVKTKVQLKT